MTRDEELEPTRPAFGSDVTESSPTIRDRRERLISSPEMGGKFDVLGYVGRGGMGAVFQVRHRHLDHIRAVKVLPPAADKDMVERFRREASIATELTHPNIVTVYDLEVLEDGSLAIVMEFLRGTDLNSHVKTKGRMDPEDVQRLFRPVADALDRMHAKGVIHRDIKPANLFMCEDGVIKILDFGISRLTESEEGLTRTGGILGTPSYMAPEQFEGEPATARTDIYSLSAVLYFCLTGRKPFEGRTQLELISHVLSSDPPRADEICPDVPDHAANAVDRGLASKPDERWPTAGALIAAMGSEDTEAFRVPRVRRRRRRRVVIGAAIVAGLVLATGVGAWLSGALREREGSEGTGHPTAGLAGTDLPEPVRGGTLRLAVKSRFPSLDPMIAKTAHYAGIQYMLYDSLVDIDWMGNTIPGLAQSWESLDDDHRYIFQLRPDAYLHEDPCLPGGKSHPADARDVQRSLERVFAWIAQDDDSTWGFLPPVLGFDRYLAGDVPHPDGIRVVDDTTIEVTFTRPTPFFAHCIGMPLWSIIAAEAIDTYGPDDIGFHAVGTGPFRLAEATDDALVLARHDKAWHRDQAGRPLPYLDRVEVRTFLGNESAKAALRQDVSDMILRLPPDSMREAMLIDGSKWTPREGFEAFKATGTLDEARRYLRIVMFDKKANKPFNEDVRLRQAMSMAIRRHEIVEPPMIATQTPLVSGMLGYRPGPVAVDGDATGAASLLAEAGYPGGEGLPPISICCTDGLRPEVDVMASQLREIGVRLNVTVEDYETWFHHLVEGGCDLVITRYADLVLDDDPTVLLLGLTSRAKLLDRQPALRELVSRLDTSKDRSERGDILNALAAALMDDAMIVFLAHRDPTVPKFTVLASEKVEGLNDPRTGLMSPVRHRFQNS